MSEPAGLDRGREAMRPSSLPGMADPIVDMQAELLAEAKQQTRALDQIKVMLGILTALTVLFVLVGLIGIAGQS